MGLSKTTRICTLLAIDSVFFLLELVSGYAVHSLALVADSFHMLNDVLSLLVGLWAVRIANRTSSEKTFTYGYQRAETLGALINGVFLVALCLSIFLDAIQRFVEPQEVSHPVLVLIVGCFGLASNIIGLFLFHEHGHGHDHGHGTSHKGDVTAAEEGQGGIESDTTYAREETGNGTSALYENRSEPLPESTPRSRQRAKTVDYMAGSGQRGGSLSMSPRKSEWRRSSHSNSRGVEDIPVHPASFRKEIIASARLNGIQSEPSSDDEHYEHDSSETAVEADDERPNERSPLIRPNSHTFKSKSRKHPPPSDPPIGTLHKDHKHNQPKASGGHGGHSHGDLNMRGVFLHVIGDALGNIGVIVSALFIWLTPFWWRFYADPAISLVITVIILGSAIPLCKAASRILLQAAPAHLSMDDVKADIEKLPGILECHHLHVWQLSGDSNLVASLHVQVEFDFKGEGGKRYMGLARQIRACLHEYGVHSSTIQPEFCLDPSHAHSVNSDVEEGGPSNHNATASLLRSGAGSHVASRQGSKTSSLMGQCILDCEDQSASGQTCCPRRKSGNEE